MIFKKLNKSGQNFTEYSLLLVLIMAGILVMGPYIKRSWNAQTKGWEDSVLDSYYDPLESSDEVLVDLSCFGQYDIPCEFPPCCGPDFVSAGMTGCSETQDTRAVWTCFAEGGGTCNCGLPPPRWEVNEVSGPLVICEEHPKCCTDWSGGGCGTGSADGSSCQVDETVMSQTCGDWGGGTVQNIRCRKDSACYFPCLDTGSNVGFHSYRRAGVCPDDDIQVPDGTTISLITGGIAACADTAKCQLYCNSNMMPGNLDGIEQCLPCDENLCFVPINTGCLNSPNGICPAGVDPVVGCKEIECGVDMIRDANCHCVCPPGFFQLNYFSRVYPDEYYPAIISDTELNDRAIFNRYEDKWLQLSTEICIQDFIELSFHLPNEGDPGVPLNMPCLNGEANEDFTIQMDVSLLAPDVPTTFSVSGCALTPSQPIDCGCGTFTNSFTLTRNLQNNIIIENITSTPWSTPTGDRALQPFWTTPGPRSGAGVDPAMWSIINPGGWTSIELSQ